MMERFIKINNEIFSVKFGMTSLMQLMQFLKNSDEQEMVKFLFYCGINYKNNFSIVQLDRLYCELLKQSSFEAIQKLLLYNLNCSLDTHFESLSLIHKFLFSLNFNEQYEELYSKTVGEMNIAPPIFYEMTPHEIELAYKGYLKKQEWQVNSLLAACCEAQKENPSKISLLDSSTIPISRKETFDLLDIND